MFDGEQIVPGGDDEGDRFIAGTVDLNQDVLTGTVPPAGGNDDGLFVDGFRVWMFKSFNLLHHPTVHPEQLLMFYLFLHGTALQTQTIQVRSNLNWSPEQEEHPSLVAALIIRVKRAPIG